MRTMVAALVAVTICTAAAANDRSAAIAKDALQHCEETDGLPGADRQAKLDHLDKTIEIAEVAVQTDPNDGEAHFALFCGLAKQLELAGLSWRAIPRLRRVQSELARSEVLLPGDVDVMVAKGELLRRLPAPLGGDRAAAVKTLKRAIAINPNHVLGRLYLARALADQRMPEARTEAYQALALAKKSGTPQERDQAEELLASLDE